MTSKSLSLLKSPALVFFVFAVANLIASFTNHIDDADEPFGYWEPLHYLLYGHGLQTWEYAPEFAIRTYAFVAPLVAIGRIAKPFMSKLDMFQLIRTVLGVFTAYSQSRFVVAIRQRFSETEGLLTMLLILLSPGVFFSSTSLLPSAVAMNLVMLSYSSWMTNQCVSCITFGCFAVLWSGWPFVAVLFIPAGAALLVSAWNKGGVWGLVRLAMEGLFILSAIAIPAMLLDFRMYGRRYAL